MTRAAVGSLLCLSARFLLVNPSQPLPLGNIFFLSLPTFRFITKSTDKMFINKQALDKGGAYNESKYQALYAVFYAMSTRHE